MSPPSAKLPMPSPLASGGLTGPPKPLSGVYTELASNARNRAPPRTAYETQAPRVANEVPSDLTRPWYPLFKHGANVLGAAALTGSVPRLAITSATSGANNLRDMGPSSGTRHSARPFAATIPPSGDGGFDRSLVLLHVSDQHLFDAHRGGHRARWRAPLDVELIIRNGAHGSGDPALARAQEPKHLVLRHAGVRPRVLSVDRALVDRGEWPAGEHGLNPLGDPVAVGRDVVGDDTDRPALVLVIDSLRKVLAREMPLFVAQRLDEADELVLGGFELLGVLVGADVRRRCHSHIESGLGMGRPVR